MFPIQVGIMVAGIIIIVNGAIDVLKLEFFKKPIGRMVFGAILYSGGIGMMALETYFP